jgi:hypothetical protein
MDFLDPINGIDCAMPSDSTKLLEYVDLREEGSRAVKNGRFFSNGKIRKCLPGGGDVDNVMVFLV